jgi:predicted aconitase with swiveling domain
LGKELEKNRVIGALFGDDHRLPKAVLLRNTQSAVAVGQLVAGLAVATAVEIRVNSRIACMILMIGMNDKQSKKSTLEN